MWRYVARRTAMLIFPAALIALAAAPIGVPAAATQPTAGGEAQRCASGGATVTARVVALDQPYAYNRFGSYNPLGMVFALRRDVVVEDGTEAGRERPDQGKPIALDPDRDSKAEAAKYAGKVRLRSDKRPRPIVLRVNEGDCLEVTFTNLLRSWPEEVDDIDVRDHAATRGTGEVPEGVATRSVGLQVNGLAYSPTGRPDDGLAPGGMAALPSGKLLAAPGETRVYRWQAVKDGTYLLHSSAGPAGGEGDGGQLALGLFGAVNVEPKGAAWYRSQVTADQLQRSTRGDGRPQSVGGRDFHAPIDYAARDESGPLLAMLDGHEIVHSDLNAVIDLPAEAQHPGGKGPFREFTTIFHDEITAVQAYPDLANEDSPMSSLRDGMAINYGSSGLGAMVLAAQKHEGPAAHCVECKLEEFFLTSWVNGDPALVLRERPEESPQLAPKLVSPYEDDPSNVHHSYIGDSVRFRNLHAGPKETHVFHLHAHQWLFENADSSSESEYNDSQTISPGAAFTYNIQWGGSGNRNLTPGDSIFHCHLYPHFAQGMWELWRSHDAFEDGTHDRWLPDADERVAGATPDHKTPTPAVVPLPSHTMLPLPTKDLRGYPFYIAGTPGHRPPQPPLDSVSDGGLPRHVVLRGQTKQGLAAVPRNYLDPAAAPEHEKVAAEIAQRVTRQNRGTALFSLARGLSSADLKLLPEEGTAEERRAMQFHAGQLTQPGATPGERWVDPGTHWQGVAFSACDPSGACDTPAARRVFVVNGRPPAPGAPYADPCPDLAWDKQGMRPVRTRRYRVAYLQFDNPVNRAGWHDPQTRSIVLEDDIAATLRYERPAEPLFFRANSGECIEFQATNLIPSNLNLDDFQVFSPTDTIGQHIHLVKFDVTSSDGSANGWNYEDATFSPEEVRERIAAHNNWIAAPGRNGTPLGPKTHRLFKEGPMAGDPRGACPTDPAILKDAVRMNREHPWCGAQSSVQRWWADPTTDPQGNDRTLRTVFTHDHLGPSSHQQHGLYAALLVEPKGSTWETLAGDQTLGGSDRDGNPLVLRPDGGPTSYAANVIPPSGCDEGSENRCKPRREFALAFADYALLYTPSRSDRPELSNLPVNPPSRTEEALPQNVRSALRSPKPEGISTKDPGSQLLNYRNEPLPLRLAEEQANGEYRLWGGTDPDPGSAACHAAVTDPMSHALNLDWAKNDPTLHSCSPTDQACIAALCDRSDPANAMSSLTHIGEQNVDRRFAFTGAAVTAGEPAGVRRPGDPATPVLAARANDLVQIRLIQGAQEENHTFTLHGGKWLFQPDAPNSGYAAAQPIGISEHFEFEARAYKPNAAANVDELYGASAVDNFWDGQWGILRILDKDAQSGLKPLPQEPATDFSSQTGPCRDASAPTQYYRVEAWHVRDLLGHRPANAPALPPAANVSREFGLVYAKRDPRGMIHDPDAIIFLTVLAERYPNEKEPAPPTQDPESQSGKRALSVLESRGWRVDPLVLRAAAGDCIKVDLVNRLPERAKLQALGEEGHLAPEHWTWDLMPPTTPGFNLNQFPMSRRVGLSPQLVTSDLFKSDGGNIGYNMDSSAPNWIVSRAPGDVHGPLTQAPIGKMSNTIRYEWYAGERRPPQAPRRNASWEAVPIEFGAVSLADFGDPLKHGSHGAVGALVIEPRGARWCAAETRQADHADQMACQGTTATVEYPSNPDQPATAGGDFNKGFHEIVLVYQDELALRWNGGPLDNLRSGDDAEDSGGKALNYHTDPLWSRLGGLPSLDPNDVALYEQTDLLADPAGAMPDHPVFEVPAGDSVRIRVVHPSGHPRNHALTVMGHHWSVGPWDADSTRQCVTDPGAEHPASPGQVGTLTAIGPRRHANLLFQAGGENKVPGDYLIRSQDAFTFAGGAWALLRVNRPQGGQPVADRVCASETAHAAQ